MVGRTFAEVSKKYFGHLRKQDWLDWWDENKHKYQPKPEKPEKTDLSPNQHIDFTVKTPVE